MMMASYVRSYTKIHEYLLLYMVMYVVDVLLLCMVMHADVC